MAFIKANLTWIIFGVIGAAGIGLGVWGFLGGSDVEAKMTTVNQLTSTVKGMQNQPQNQASVAAKAKEIERRKQEAERAKDVALSVQKNNAFYETVESGVRESVPRKPLVDNVLPDPAPNSADPITFREKYKAEFDMLTARLRPGEKPSTDEIQSAGYQIDINQKNPIASGKVQTSPWDLVRIFGATSGSVDVRDKTPLDILRNWAASVAAYKRARGCRVYVDPGAFVRHKLATGAQAPPANEIWQAQMSLWIQQDIVTAIARLNEKRAGELAAANRADDDWVAFMPVKHIEKVAIGNHLGGVGGGSNLERVNWATSMTGKVANNDMFVVPIQLHLVIEEAALPGLLEEFCSVGFYTPIGIQFSSIPPNPLQVNYVYGDVPVIKLQLDLEGYYFHVVFGQWIPKDLQDMLKKPYADSNDPFGNVAPMGGGMRPGGRRP